MKRRGVTGNVSREDRHRGVHVYVRTSGWADGIEWSIKMAIGATSDGSRDRQIEKQRQSTGEHRERVRATTHEQHSTRTLLVS